jgi:hypothetical protein
VHLPENKTYTPDLAIRLSFHIQHWGDITSHAKQEAIYRLERLGVDKETLQNAYFDTEDHTYLAIEPRLVRRQYGVPVEAFYLHDPKKREQLIKQRRLVPDSHREMVEMYGKTETEVAA